MAIQWIGKPILFFTSAARGAARLRAPIASESPGCEARDGCDEQAYRANWTRAQLEGQRDCAHR